MNDAPMPLEGVRVLDLSGWQTGEGGTAMIADLGADVIKVEPPRTGDPGRTVTPDDPNRPGFNLFYEVMNRNKRSIVIDLKNARGRELFLRLVEHADVVAENFRVGTMERLGIGYDVLSARNPKIILASVNGFGPKGPDASVAVFDILGHSRSGLMYLLSDPERPMRYIGGHGIADHNGAIHFAYAMVTALAARGIHGIGQHVYASQLGGLMQHQMLPINNYLLTGSQPWDPQRRQKPGALFTFYDAADGHRLTLGCTPEYKYWPVVCEILGRTDLLDDPRYTDSAGRTENAGPLIAEFAAAFKTRPRAEWCAALAKAGVPFSPLNQYSDLAIDPQAIDNEYIVEVDHPVAGPIREVGVPITFSRTRARVRRTSPKLGEHTEEVLMEFGVTSAETASLRKDGAFG